MRYVELLIQGIRGFTGKQRIILDDKRTWLRTIDQTQSDALAHVLRSALDPGHFQKAAGFLNRNGDDDPGRFSLIFEQDEQRKRLVGNTKHGYCVLGEWDAAGEQFVKTSDHPQDYAASLKLDAIKKFHPIFFASDFEIPQSDTDLSSDSETEDLPTDPGTIKEKLEELLAERAMMDSMNKLEDDIDVLRQRQFKLEDDIRQYESQIEAHALAVKNLERTAAIETVDKSLIQKAKNWKEHTQRVIDQQHRLDQRIEDTEDEFALLNQVPIWHKDPLFLAVSVLTLAGFIVPPIIKQYNFALIGFFGLLAGMPFVIWKTQKHLRNIQATKDELENLRREARQLADDKTREESLLKDLTKKMQVMDIMDLGPLLDQRIEMQAEADKHQKILDDHQSVENKSAAEAEIKEILDDIRGKELSLQEAGTAHLDTRSVDENIEKLEAQLAKLEPKTETTSNHAGPLAEIVEAGAPISGSAATFCEQVAGFVNKVLGKLVEGGASNVSIDDQGNLSGYNPDLGLSEAAWQELVIAAASLGAARAVASHLSMPVLWNLPFANVDDTQLQAFAGIAARAAGPIPLIVLSSRSAFAEAFQETAIE